MSSVPTFKYGYVVGRFINSKGDADDLDRLPDVVGAKLSPTFTRVRGQYVQPLDEPEFGIHGAMVYHEPVVTGVTDQGFLTGDVDSTGKPLADAKPGVWLVTGRYRVSLGSQFPAVEIEVLESHTEDDPLDLSTEQDYVPPPGVIVNTLPLPSGGEPGQVYGWTGSSIGWYTPESGPSAYEVALRNGFSGDVDAWLLSLKGLQGDPGISAYEVARSQGFSGTVNDWLASLKGLKGDAGFSAYQLAKTNGFSGTVTEWLDSLVGRQGDPGPPGSPTEYIKVGPGRPDTPSTTGGVITGSEPVGAEYRSTDGANVGAWTWTKRPGGKWHVTNGDSGWREVTAETWVHETNTYAVPGGTRMGTVIRLTTAGMDLIVRGSGGGTNPGVAIAANQHLRIPILRSLLPAQFTWNSYSSLPHGLQEYYGDISIQWGRAPAAVWFLPRDPAAWPSTLPGTPA